MTTKVEGKAPGGGATSDRGGATAQKSGEGKEKAFEAVMARQQARSEGRCGDDRGRKLMEGDIQRQGEEKKTGLSSEGQGGGVDVAAREEAGAAMEGPSQKREAGGVEGQVVENREARSEAMGQKEASSVEGRTPVQTVDEVARRVVEAIHMGRDHRQRQVLFLDVKIPGRGDIRIRLRQEGGGYAVRMRADNDGLARELQRGSEGLREAGAQRGVVLHTIEVHRSAGSQG